MTYRREDLQPSLRSQIVASNVPRRFWGLEMADLDPAGYAAPATLPAIEQWLISLREGKILRAEGLATCGKGLLLVGKPGTGKTTLSCAILQDVIRTLTPEQWGAKDRRLTRPAYYLSYPEILQLMKDRMDNDEGADRTLRSLFGHTAENAVRLLVVDDLGKEYRHANRWAETMFDHLLRARFDEGWPTIVTTNVPLRDWDDVYGEAMGSFAHEAFVPLGIMSVEGDRRRTKQR